MSDFHGTIDDEFDYIQDYYDEAAAAGSPDPLEEIYLAGKGAMRSDTAASVNLLRQVAAQAPPGGRWCFKAFKMLARAYGMAGDNEECVKTYRTIATYPVGPEVTCAAVEKAMLKFLRGQTTMPSVLFHEAVDVAVEVARARLPAYRILLIEALLLRAERMVVDGLHADAFLPLREAEQDLQRRTDGSDLQASAALCRVYAVLCQAYLAAKNYDGLRGAYVALGRVPTLLLSPATLGTALECGGHLFLHDADWRAARHAFNEARHRCSDADTVEMERLGKYWALATMLCGDEEVAVQLSMKAAAEGQAVRELCEAYRLKEVGTAIAILEDAAHSAYFLQDSLFSPYVDPLLRQLRLSCLCRLLTAYNAIEIRSVAALLAMEEEACEEFCMMAINCCIVEAHLEDRTEGGVVLVREGRGLGQRTPADQLLGKLLSALQPATGE